MKCEPRAFSHLETLRQGKKVPSVLPFLSFSRMLIRTSSGRVSFREVARVDMLIELFHLLKSSAALPGVGFRSCGEAFIFFFGVCVAMLRKGRC